MWRIGLIVFLFVHAAIHVAIWASPAAKAPDAPFDSSESWLLGSQRSISMAVALVTAVLLAAAAVGLSVHADWWRSVAIVGLASSFGLMIVWFNPWFTFIEAVNAALFVGLAFLSWPSSDLVGA